VENGRFFGGDESRWSYGYKWLLFRFLLMFGHRLDINPGLTYFINQSDQFRNAIRTQANRVRQYKDENGVVVREFQGAGFGENECNIIGFVDANPYRTSRLGSGPVGQKASIRKPNWKPLQQAIYSRYGKMHGLKPLALVIPNGIACLYGPVSVRR
jgi:hypothetical protein